MKFELAWVCISLLLTSCAFPHRPPAAPEPPEPPQRASPEGEVDPPRAPGATPLDGDLASGEARPSVVAVVQFDVNALPVATWSNHGAQGGFVIRTDPQGYEVSIQGPAFSEITVVGPSLFDTFTGGSFATGQPPACGRGQKASLAATWTGFLATTWTDEGVTVEMGRATFDTTTCKAVPLATLSARAAAIVPGYVYALRVLRPATAREPSHEDLVTFLPRGAFVSAGGDPREPLRTSASGTFTRLTFPLLLDTAGSASVRVSPACLELWAALRRTRHPVFSFQEGSATNQDAIFAVDVVSHGNARRGSIAVSVPQGVSAPSYTRLLAAVAHGRG